MVLFLDRVAYVDEFAVFEDEEIMFCSESFEACGGFGAEVGEDVYVCFEACDVRTKFYRGFEVSVVSNVVKTF